MNYEKDKELTEREERVRQILSNRKKLTVTCHSEDSEKLRRKHQQEWAKYKMPLESQGYF